MPHSPVFLLRMSCQGVPLAPGESEEGIAAGGDHEGADLEIAGGDEAGGGVGSGAPGLAVGDESAHDDAAAHGGRVVVDGDGGAVEGDVGLGGGAG